MKSATKLTTTTKARVPNRAQRRAAVRATKTGRAAPTHERWYREAMRVESAENPLSTPYEVFLEEARGAASFLTRYWKPTETTPGLMRLRRRLPLATAQEIHELLSAVQIAQTEATLTVVAGPSLTDRAEEIVTELSLALSFTLDDGVEDDDDARFARVRASHAKRGDGPAAVGQDLLNHATLAARLRERLVHDDEEFDAGLIDEGLLLAAKLTATSLRPPPVEPAETPAANDATNTADTAGVTADAPVDPLALRNRLLRLLVNRVALVRRAARRVFAKLPDVLAEVTSAYEREKRAERRKAQAKRKTPEGNPPAPEPVGAPHDG